MSFNILVTGGAGYLGSTMVPDLLSADHKVTVLDNFMFKQSSLNHCCYHTNFNAVKGDIRQKDTMSKLMKEADIIIPLVVGVLFQDDPHP
jgi:nucleoside-diphosphate-sugar epimerase